MTNRDESTTPRTVMSLGLFAALLPAGGAFAGVLESPTTLEFSNSEAMLETASAGTLDFEAWAARQAVNPLAMLDDPDGDDDDSDDDDCDDDDNGTAAASTFAGAGQAAAEETGGVVLKMEARTMGSVIDIYVLTWDQTMSELSDVRVAAETGVVLGVETFEPGPSQVQQIASVMERLSTATITFEQAINIAAAEQPNGMAHEVELGTENTGLEFGVDLVETTTHTPIDVDAATGVTSSGDPAAQASDFDGNGSVDISDMLELVGMWGSVNPHYDTDSNGSVDVGDLMTLLAQFGL